MVNKKKIASTKSPTKKKAEGIISKKKGKEEEQLIVVGIGGSAGSLGPTEQFFMNMPLGGGIAFVVIQHLLAGKNSMLAELIGRNTKMPVKMVEEETLLEKDHVYVISPSHELLIKNNKLISLERSGDHATKFSINTFFDSLASSYKEKAVGVVLSGMGDDGTEGIKSIKKNNGMVLVQEPNSAIHDSMPRHAIATGLVDFVLLVEDIPEQLLHSIKHKPSTALKKQALSDPIETVLQKILQIVHTSTGHDFTFYKTTTVLRRIERRMLMHQCSNMSQYLLFLEKNHSEAEVLFHEILIGVTNFFREPDAFEALKNNVFPLVLRNKPEGNIRVWIPSCSTGEEVYSMAIILIEYLEKSNLLKKYKIQIFGTDIDYKAIQTARLGIYSEMIKEDISEERINRFFDKKDSQRFQIKKEIRELVVFAPQSLVKDPPFTKLDILSCRNFMIYVNSEMQRKLISLFHYALNPEGILFLGSSETIGGSNDLFIPVSSKNKIFKKSGSPSSYTGTIGFSLAFIKGKLNEPSSIKYDTAMSTKKVIPEKVQKALLANYAPPSVVITGSGDILYINGDAGKYLEFAPGQASLNIIKIAREGLKFELVKAIQEASSKGDVFIHKNLKVKEETGYKTIHLIVRPFYEKDMEGMLLVSFENAGIEEEKKLIQNKSDLNSAELVNVEELERELKQTKVQLQNSIQEMEATLEEMTSNNEEIQSTNEELQSANEELTTSKEELQSLNEELVTVNVELNAKMDEYSQVNNDIKNLLDSTDIATIFLDNNLNIKRFTSHAKNIFKLIPVDIGRPITDIVSNLKYKDFIKDVRTVLETLSYKRVEVEVTDNHWYEMRILPYRTIDNYIGGVVITFTDITRQRKLEQEIGSVKVYAAKIIETVRDPIVVLDEELKVKYANKAFYKKFKAKEKDTIGYYLFDLGNNQWDIPELRKLLLEILPEKKEMEDFSVESTFSGIGAREMLLNARKLDGYGDDLNLILLAIEDVTGRNLNKHNYS